MATALSDLLTEAEAAEKLRMGERTLRDERRKGCIRYVRLAARKIAYRPEDLAEYVSARVTQESICEPKPKPKRRVASRSGNVISFPDYMS